MCLCTGQGKTLAKLKAQLLKQMKATFSTKAGRELLGSGRLVARLATNEDKDGVKTAPSLTQNDHFFFDRWL